MSSERSERVGWRRAGRVAAVLAVSLVGLLSLVSPVAAHSTLISSSPAADAVLPTPPTSVHLVFSEEIRDFQPKLAITVGDHDPVEITPTVNGALVDADLNGLDLPTAVGLDPVAWKIGYRVVSADGHPISGLVPFSVGDGPAPSSPPTGPAPADGSAGAGGTLAGDSGAPAESGWGPWGWWVLMTVAGASVAAGAALLLRCGRSAARRAGAD